MNKIGDAKCLTEGNFPQLYSLLLWNKHLSLGAEENVFDSRSLLELETCSLATLCTYSLIQLFILRSSAQNAL